jgi:hypothetical protein
MAIRAQQPHVLALVVRVVAVDVIDLQWDVASLRMSLRPAASRTAFSAFVK